MTIILLIRHGLNDWVGKRLVGRTPGIHLNETGKQQAQLVCSTLENLHFSAIYSSPLERAMETAQPLALKLSIPIQIEENLQEIDFGSWQGKTNKQMRRLKLWQTVQEFPEKMRFPKGESFLEAQQRLVKCIEAIHAKHAENDLVACFSHSDSIRLIVSHYLGIPLSAFQRVAIDTASISVLIRHKERIFVPYINQVVAKPFAENLKVDSENKGNTKKE